MAWGTLSPGTVVQGPAGPQGSQGPQGPQGVPGTAAAHHATHEPGGTDAIVGAAWLNQNNIFTGRSQQINGATPFLGFQDTSQTVDARSFLIQNTANQLVFRAYNDAYTVLAATPLILDRTGNATVGGNLLVTKIRPEIQLLTPADTTKARLTSVVPGGRVDLTTNLSYSGANWMRDDTTKPFGLMTLFENGQLGIWNGLAGANPAGLTLTFLVDTSGNMTIPGQITCGPVISTGPSQFTASEFRIIGQSNYARLHLRDTTSAAGSQTFVLINYQQQLTLAPATDDGLSPVLAGSWLAGITLNRSGSVQLWGPIYPGYGGGGGTGAQANYFLSAHTTWGLYSNTSIFFLNGVYTNTLFYSYGTGTSLGDLTVRGSTGFQNSVTVTGGNVIVNAGYVQCSGYMYPGRADAPGTAQSTWVLASHGSYGLYINTGLFVMNDLWCASVNASGNLLATGVIRSGNQWQAYSGGWINMDLEAASFTFTIAQTTEVMRISGGGSILIGTAAIYGTSLVTINASGAAHMQGITIKNTDAGNSIAYLQFVSSGGGSTGQVTQLSASSVQYTTTSDARLKHDCGRATDLTNLRRLVIHDFDWMVDGVRDRGVFAQEAYDLFPRAIVVGTDERTDSGDLLHPWGTDYSKFVADLIVGWQQHEIEIADLRTELAFLKRTVLYAQ